MDSTDLYACKTASGKSVYKNESNDHGVVIDFRGEYWALRDRKGEAVTTCHPGAEDDLPPVGLSIKFLRGSHACSLIRWRC